MSHVARLTEANQVIQLICFCNRRKFTERANVMHRNRHTDHLVAPLTRAIITFACFPPCFVPIATAIGFGTAYPSRGIYAGFMLMAIVALTTLRAIFSDMAAMPDLPGLAGKWLAARGARQLNRLHPRGAITSCDLPRNECIGWTQTSTKFISSQIRMRIWPVLQVPFTAASKTTKTSFLFAIRSYLESLAANLTNLINHVVIIPQCAGMGTTGVAQR